MKTTVDLRDDLHSLLVAQFGKRKLSKAINELLFEHLFREKKRSMFGADPWLAKVSRDDVRDHVDREF